MYSPTQPTPHACPVHIFAAAFTRHQRHTCAHIQAWGKLRAVRQQQQQAGALSALWTWSLTGQHYRRQLVVRCMKAWRAAAAEGAAVVAGVTGALRALRTHQVLAAWWGYVQEQVGRWVDMHSHETLFVNGWVEPLGGWCGPSWAFFGCRVC